MSNILDSEAAATRRALRSSLSSTSILTCVKDPARPFRQASCGTRQALGIGKNRVVGSQVHNGPRARFPWTLGLGGVTTAPGYCAMWCRPHTARRASAVPAGQLPREYVDVRFGGVRRADRRLDHAHGYGTG